MAVPLVFTPIEIGAVCDQLHIDRSYLNPESAPISLEFNPVARE
ncbi:MAG: hypothetical protein ACTSRE_16970 [Promethearchaeota archaeon]